MELVQYLKTVYGLAGKLKRLPGYEDENYLLKAEDQSYVIKIAAPGSSVNEDWELQHQLLGDLNRSELEGLVPRVVASSNSNLVERFRSRSLRVLTFLEGSLIKDVPADEGLFRHVGETLGTCDLVFNSIPKGSNEGNNSAWNNSNAHLALDYVQLIKGHTERNICWYFLKYFDEHIRNPLRSARKSYIHSDANEQNIVVKNGRVSGLIDFGDITYTALINEVSVAIAYLLMAFPDNGIDPAVHLLKGYHSKLPLEISEVNLIYYLVASRATVSYTMAAKAAVEQPESLYHQSSAEPARQFLKKWISYNPKEVTSKFLSCCGHPVDESSHETLLKRRESIMGKNMSLNYYPDVIATEKAAFQYMYGQDGRTYLDGVNNISHVGHCHPKVVEAGQAQMSLLNTNTRYLYEILPAYCERLSNLLPAKLEVVYLVNSGSEANDLAMRLARAHTRNQDMIVLDGAYHGHTTANIEISPYKYKAKGGFEKKGYVHELSVPDGFRGRFGYDNTQAANLYQLDAETLLKKLSHVGIFPAAFICESMLGCGGQIALPHGYLSRIYETVRSYGGVCIADEVQVGFGRTGRFWAFEEQGVVPDIVVMGKPIGNGHPLAAVVCTREIADSFANGMEYFNSFGGNPVSCAIGNAVLDVIEEEQLQSHAATLGGYIKEQWQELASSNECIGDVRGEGLFLGMELVHDGTSLIPADDLAENIVRFLRKKGIMLSTDGPFHNVLKFKPPMCFSQSNADQLFEALRKSLCTFQS